MKALNTLRLLCLFLAAICLSPAQALELKEKIPKRLDNQLVMQISVQLGPREDMGKGPDGMRINYPIIGGSFTGKGVKGTVVPGGADMSVTRDDGVTLINALYRLKTDDGQLIIIDNPGIWRLNESGLAKKAKGLELRDMQESDFYCRTTPRFKTQPGANAWLNDYVFVGTIDGISEHEVLISVYKVGGV
ncbi:MULTISPECIES: DUF3237 domain-containing protein [unclassified Pseudomonas]|uniref:DUF3237 domain-containing protein n=1 Tax=unclassified Pseudomonas TaxID=196821 RepID=UPI0021C9FDBA|nr:MULTISPECIES: DUF3237 domain-containing protein [unclassified Pseudomonas]MCU1735030.1 DUF3237 domain-containing protein [Pseudomonas sp. 20P_3.2_Bac4]MCU1743505.1 DUF3237 domain-containing protein [Pseudomonas sp. 20P_3.2_Bac5]